MSCQLTYCYSLVILNDVIQLSPILHLILGVDNVNSTTPYAIPPPSCNNNTFTFIMSV